MLALINSNTTIVEAMKTSFMHTFEIYSPMKVIFSVKPNIHHYKFRDVYIYVYFKRAKVLVLFQKKTSRT